MTYRVRVLPEAALEDEASAEWYEQRRPGLLAALTGRDLTN